MTISGVSPSLTLSVACWAFRVPWNRIAALILDRGVDPIWLDNVYCLGSEDHIEECYYQLGYHNCYHGEDVGVICTPKGKNCKSGSDFLFCFVRKTRLYMYTSKLHFEFYLYAAHLSRYNSTWTITYDQIPYNFHLRSKYLIDVN